MGAVILGSALKSLTGMGLPAIAIPIISLFVGIEVAVVVISLPNFALNAAMSWREREGAKGAIDLPVLLVTGFLGGIAGSLLFVSVSEKPLVALLVLAVVGYILAYLIQPEAAIGAQTSRRWAPVVGTVGGMFQGAIGISGPILGSWVHAHRLDRQCHVFCLTTLFLASGSIQLVILIANGEVTGLWTASILACVPALATVPIGSRLRGKISSRAFDYLVLGAISAAGLGLGIRTFL